MAMKLEYVKIKRYTKNLSCPHNDACKCSKQTCWKCGWNPTVAQKRLDKFQEKTRGA